jgi:hypothetical protein
MSNQIYQLLENIKSLQELQTVFLKITLISPYILRLRLKNVKTKAHGINNSFFDLQANVMYNLLFNLQIDINENI